jgi:DNA-binding transcriptional ArsR family regulator
MLESLFESEKKEKILFFLYSHGEGYAREIARTFRFNLNTVQNQLKKLESHGVLYSRLRGKVRIFSFNPRYPFKKELGALLKKAMMYLPEKEVERYYWPRLQPKKTGKPQPEHSLQGRISFALSNPWEKSQLNRFKPSQKTSKTNRES